MTRNSRQKRAARALSNISGMPYTAARRALARSASERLPGAPDYEADPTRYGWGEPVPEDGFNRLDEYVRETKKWDGIELLDVGMITTTTTTRDADLDYVVDLTVRLRGVVLKVWPDGYDDDRCLAAYTDDDEDSYVDPIDHIEEGGSTDALHQLVDEVQWFWERHGYRGLAEYREHLRGGS